MGFGILTFIWTWSVVSDTSLILIWTLYFDFEDANNIHVLEVMIWGFGGHLMFLTRVLDLDFDSIGHWSLIHPSSGFWLFILIIKLHRTSLSFKFLSGLWRMLGGSWLGFSILVLICTWSLICVTPPIPNMALYLHPEGVKNIHDL